MGRITLTISEEEKKALSILSARERRDPRDQAALLLRWALEEVGVLAPPVLGSSPLTPVIEWRARLVQELLDMEGEGAVPA